MFDILDRAAPEAQKTTRAVARSKTAAERNLIGLLCGLAVVCIAFVSYWNCLQGYFLADDLLPLHKFYETFNGHPEVLLQNLVSPWMQDRNFVLVYRPLVELSLVWDYLWWHSDAFGYHLSNLVIHAYCALALFVVCRRLLRDFGGRQSTLAAFFAASLFAAYPAHSEPVIWIVGRGDLLCAAFCLTAIGLFVNWCARPKHGYLQALSVLSCILAFLSKEMAITLPAILFAYCLYTGNDSQSLKRRLTAGWRATGPFWAAATVYLLLRVAVLGTVFGGHLGSVQERLAETWLQRTASLSAAAMPISAGLINAGELEGLLRSLYFSAAILLLVRITWSPWTVKVTRLMLFTGSWLLLAALPACPNWMLDANLAGGRFLYLGAAPLALLFTLIFLPIEFSDENNKEQIRRRNLLLAVTICLLTGFLSLFIYTSRQHAGLWLNASWQMRGIASSLQAEASKLPANSRISILNLPRDIDGAPMFYWFEMVAALLQPPLSGSDLSGRVGTIEPWMIGNTDLLNKARLKEMLNNGQIKTKFYLWDADNDQLMPASLPSGKSWRGRSRQLPVNLASADNEEKLEIWLGESLSTASIDFVALNVSCSQVPRSIKPKSDKQLLTLEWADTYNQCFDLDRQAAVELIADGKPHSYIFNVAQLPGWILSGAIDSLLLEIPEGTRAYVHDLTLLNGDQVTPYLEADRDSLNEGQNGVFTLRQGNARFRYDASSIAGVKKVVVEISKPTSCFQHYTGTLRDRVLSPRAHKLLTLHDLKGYFDLPPGNQPRSAKFQVRIAALSDANEVLGTFSDPVTVEAPCM